MGAPEPCHRFQRCKIEEPHPCGREPWHSVLEKILFVYMLFIIKFFFLLVPLPPAAEEKKNPVLADVNLAIAFSDVKQKNPVLTDVNLGTPRLKNYSIYLFFSALAASIILFAWSCGTSSYLTKSIWKEPLACVIALRSIAYLNISE